MATCPKSQLSAVEMSRSKFDTTNTLDISSVVLGVMINMFEVRKALSLVYL